MRVWVRRGRWLWPGMSVPVSVGPPRVSMDKSGKESVTYDVIVNPKVIQEAADDKTGGYRCAVVCVWREQRWGVCMERAGCGVCMERAGVGGVVSPSFT